MRTLNNFIDGQWRPPSNATHLPDINPADTEEIVAKAPSSQAADSVMAVEAAERAYPASNVGWKLVVANSPKC